MLKDAYLLRGLDALSRAHETNYFTDGHRGAVIVAAYYLCREIEMEEGADDLIRALVDQHWTHTALCAPLPDEAPEPEGIGRILEALQSNMTGLRVVGHNVILPALALKALRQLPHAVTPTRVDGLCRLIEAFDTVKDIHLGEGDDLPDWGAPADVAEFVSSEVTCFRTNVRIGRNGRRCLSASGTFSSIPMGSMG